MNLTKVVVALCSIFLIMLGADKFFNFLEPPCTLMDSVPTALWISLGVVDIIAGILIWIPRFRKPIAWLFIILMLIFTVMHLLAKTYDIGGALFLAALFALLVWDPSFMQGKKQTS